MTTPARPAGSTQTSGGAMVAYNPAPQQAPWFAARGMPGATTVSRYMGGTISGAPESGTFVSGDFVVDQSGAVWICTAGGSPGKWAGSATIGALAAAVAAVTAEIAALYTTAEPLASGEAIIPRIGLTGDVPMTLGQMLLTYWTAATTGTATTVTTATGLTAGDTLTYAAVGVYSVAGNGDLALLAGTGDLSATLWASASTVYPSTLSPSFPRVAGTRYATGVLAAGTSAPTLTGNAHAGTFGAAPLVAATYGSGLAALPATAAHASITAAPGMTESVISP